MTKYKLKKWKNFFKQSYSEKGILEFIIKNVKTVIKLIIKFALNVNKI
jgi:hypothetical protein